MFTDTTTKMTETTAAEVHGTVNSIIDKFAARLTGATTPINLDINIAVGLKGSIGDVDVAVTSENYGTVTNGAYRGEAFNQLRQQDTCKCECTKDQEEKPSDSSDYDPESLPTEKQEVHSTDAEQQGKVAEAENELKSLEEKHETSSYAEKVADNYYNKVCKLSRTIADAKDEDILVNVLVGCQLTRKFNSLNYSIRSDFSFIDERAVSKRLDFILTSFGIDTRLAQDVYSRIHDCLGFDVFTIKAKDNNVYIICGNVDGIVETFCSATASETSMQFITRMMEINR